MASRTPPRSARTSVEFGSVLAGATPVQKSVRINLNGDVALELERLNRDLAEAKAEDERLNRNPVAPSIATRIVELTEQARAGEVEFVFKAIGRRAWADLVAAHPPAPDDRKAGADFNTKTMPVAAMAASCIEPTGASIEAFEELADSDNVTESQWAALWIACHSANTGSADVPFSAAAFALVRPTETS